MERIAPRSRKCCRLQAMPFFSDYSLPPLSELCHLRPLYMWIGAQFASESSDMAITHDELSIRNYRTADISSRISVFLVGSSVFCGLVGFILCLAGEASRSEATWMILTIQDSGKGYRCSFNGSGKTPLAFALAAFLLFAVAMFAEHAYMLIAITAPLPLTTDPSPVSPATKAHKWQTCILFLTTWICFAIAEVLLMIAIGVESGHLNNWDKPRLTCPVIRPGLVAVAGVFGLITVFLGVALYLTALRTQRLHLEERMDRQYHLGPPTTNLPGGPTAIRAYQSQAPLSDASSLNKTSNLPC